MTPMEIAVVDLIVVTVKWYLLTGLLVSVVELALMWDVHWEEPHPVRATVMHFGLFTFGWMVVVPMQLYLLYRDWIGDPI